MLSRSTTSAAVASLSQAGNATARAVSRRTFTAGALRCSPSASSSASASSSEASSSSSTPQTQSQPSAAAPSAPSASASASSSSPSSPPSNRPGVQQPPAKTKKFIPANSPILDKVMPLSFPSKTLRSFPSLLHYSDPVLDPHPSSVIHVEATGAAPFPSTTTFYNEPKHFEPTPPRAESLILSSASDSDEVNSEQYLATVTPLSAYEIRNLHRHAIAVKRVVHMTTKGKDASMYALVVAGNGNGLVGYGEGKDTNASSAGRKAFHAAVKNLDSVPIHVGSDGSRTVETQLEYKWGASRVVLRPRPAGFGLRVPPVIHAICRSAGITDLSAAIYGSTNPLNVVKAALQILWGGAAPLGFGGVTEGGLRRNDKGQGMRVRADIERSRGRRIQEVRMGGGR